MPMSEVPFPLKTDVCSSPSGQEKHGNMSLRKRRPSFEAFASEISLLIDRSMDSEINIKGLESYAVGIDMDVDTPDETPLMTLTLISIVVHAFFVCAMHC